MPTAEQFSKARCGGKACASAHFPKAEQKETLEGKACTLVNSECGAFPFHTLVEDVVYSTMYFTGTWVECAACVQLN